MEPEKNETARSSPDAHNSKALHYDQRSRLYEILSVLALTGGAALFWYGAKTGNALEIFAAIILLGLAVALFITAVRQAARVQYERGLATQTSRYLISKYRIHTLEQVNAPKDVTSYLMSIHHPSHHFTEAELLGELRGALGSERTKEVRDIVLKYTRVDEEQTSDIVPATKTDPVPI
jgi:hypothetical protein